ncbi:hypothetical protein [Peptoniphilus sp. BV3C26]|uniref:hypothetical protein n=1 Tax=Peptoniphilus sp. BV3C26 TaxID=1111134 RepID=UPI0003B83D25|nr:hypothetical protein [Peptoniphilus sp. BV3C26]ERT62221.1 hypothetical protein HMPREF1253_1176 [Peptoniphilus sp. BV3C26]
MAFEQKTVKVMEKEYVLQKLPIRKALEIRQKWTLPSGITDDVTMYDECLANIVVNPKVKIEDFDDLGELELLIAECLFFQYMVKNPKSSEKK